ncbi:MAG TPA: hypothetical protein PKM73_18905 [Verrucomicrobiota bacterium]|nr:hypothetical protein [Verrucomicrobiota bacterium]HNU52960.1 hypothetical protein [Verrucomicrobiota bacterium]
MKLWLIAVLLGLAGAGVHGYGLLKPAEFGAALRRFPRSMAWGYILMPLATIWFLYNLKTDDIADFDAFKPVLFIGFAVVGFGACAFVRDFLAVRGLSVLALLFAKLVLDAARVVDTPWRLVLVVWAYLCVILGVWFTISPWRMRDLIMVATANERRVRITSAVRCTLSLFLIILGLTVFRESGALAGTP